MSLDWKRSTPEVLALEGEAAAFVRGPAADGSSPARTPSTPCGVCGTPRADAVLDGLCPRCLLASASETAYPRIADYELIDRVGEGGMGEVDIARHVVTGHFYAIKFPKPALLESPAGAAAFRHEIEIATRLIHRNIARVHGSGAHEGRAYFVMDLLEGGTLEDRRNRERYREPEQVLALMLKLARAVQFAHARAILHCDLKPANILFDLEGEPHVSDFGLARTLDASGIGRESLLPGATEGWKSPEQERDQGLSVATDVHNLGLLLCWLLRDGAAQGVAAGCEQRPWSPTLGWSLAAIGRRALERSSDPRLRYRAAGELADDLERAQKGLPIRSEQRRFARRALKWVWRHPIAALLAIELALLLLYVPFMPLAVVEEVRSTIKNQNAFSAVAQAGAVMNELRALALRVEGIARDPEVAALVRHRNLALTPAVLAAYNPGFDSVSVFAVDGTHSARSPRPPRPDFGPNCAFRDYFRCARQLADDFGSKARGSGASERIPVCVSRPHRSLWDGEVKLGLAAPLFEDGVFVGVLEASTKARDRFGAVQMKCGRGECLTALLGPRDRDDPAQPLPNTISILAQPGLPQGMERLIEPAVAGRICAELGCDPGARAQFEPQLGVAPLILDDYADPLSGVKAIAAIAPVGGTSLSVLVATPENAADALTERMAGAIKGHLWIPLAFGALAWGVSLAGPFLRGEWLRRGVRAARGRRG